MLAQFRPAIVSTVVLTLLLGVAYPLAVTGISALAFPRQAQGSLVRDSAGAVVGSSLIAQGFEAPRYLHPRPSAAGKGYDAAGSSGSNLGPLNEDLAARQKPADSPPPSPAIPQHMVRCPVCGVHLPHGDALVGRQGEYCSAAHRQQGLCAHSLSPYGRLRQLAMRRRSAGVMATGTSR